VIEGWEREIRVIGKVKVLRERKERGVSCIPPSNRGRGGVGGTPRPPGALAGDNEKGGFFGGAKRREKNYYL